MENQNETSTVDHSQKHVHDAFGISGERMDEVQERINKFFAEECERGEKEDGKASQSRIVEKIVNEFSKEEIALVMTSLAIQLREKEMEDDFFAFMGKMLKSSRG